MRDLKQGMKCSKNDLWLMVAILHKITKNYVTIHLTEFYDTYSVPHKVENKYIYS